VTARPPQAPVDPVFARQPIDVYRTPGAQALPGVADPDGAAGLFVRGGDVSEVLVSLDDAVIAHPYRYETPTGGFRGAVDPLLISGLAFSTGGFSARFGNVVSAVMICADSIALSCRKCQGRSALPVRRRRLRRPCESALACAQQPIGRSRSCSSPSTDSAPV
jgi:hypothetical protein